MADKSLNEPLSGAEIKDIILSRIRAKLDTDCTLSDDIAYAGFRFDYLVNVKYLRSLTGGTMAWGASGDGEITDPTGEVENEFASIVEVYETDSPNGARVEHDLLMPVGVQTPQGVERRKVRLGRPPKVRVDDVESVSGEFRP